LKHWALQIPNFDDNHPENVTHSQLFQGRSEKSDFLRFSEERYTQKNLELLNGAGSLRDQTAVRPQIVTQKTSKLNGHNPFCHF
jgi:hypothetical protein